MKTKEQLVQIGKAVLEGLVLFSAFAIVLALGYVFAELELEAQHLTETK